MAYGSLWEPVWCSGQRTRQDRKQEILSSGLALGTMPTGWLWASEPWEGDHGKPFSKTDAEKRVFQAVIKKQDCFESACRHTHKHTKSVYSSILLHVYSKVNSIESNRAYFLKNKWFCFLILPVFILSLKSNNTHGFLRMYLWIHFCLQMSLIRCIPPSSLCNWPNLNIYVCIFENWNTTSQKLLKIEYWINCTLAL